MLHIGTLNWINESLQFKYFFIVVPLMNTLPGLQPKPPPLIVRLPLMGIELGVIFPIKSFGLTCSFLNCHMLLEFDLSFKESVFLLITNFDDSKSTLFCA
jgi:hypothetical protein